MMSVPLVRGDIDEAAQFTYCWVRQRVDGNRGMTAPGRFAFLRSTRPYSDRSVVADTTNAVVSIQHCYRNCYRTAILIVALAVGSFFCFLPIASVRADWPLVRGDSRASGVASCELPAAPEVVWKYQVKDAGFEATAVVAAGVVYVGDTEGEFHAVRLADGKPVWTRKFPDSGFLNGSAVAGQRLYVNDMNGVVRCLTTNSGDVIWEHPTESDIYAAPNVVELERENGEGTSLVLITTDDGRLIALAADSGRPQWEYAIEAPLRCWPTVADGKVLLAGCDQRLHAVDVATAQETGGVDIDGPTGCAPALREGCVYFGTESGTFYAVDTSPDVATNASADASTEDAPDAAPDTSPMRIAWTFQDPNRAQAIRSAAAVDRDTVVFGSRSKRLYALDRATGKQRWHFPVRSRVDSSPVIVGRRVFFATQRGRLYAVGIDSGKAEWQYDAGGNFLASPAVAEDRLMIGNEDGTLYCFGKKE